VWAINIVVKTRRRAEARKSNKDGLIAMFDFGKAMTPKTEADCEGRHIGMCLAAQQTFSCRRTLT